MIDGITLSSQIDDLELCMRTLNALKAADIWHVGSLARMHVGGLKKIPNIGNRTIEEIGAALTDAGFSIGMPVGDWTAPLTFADVMGQQRDADAEAARQRKEELRDHFAGLAMQGLLANEDARLRTSTECARIAYEHADAALRAREASQ